MFPLELTVIQELLFNLGLSLPTLPASPMTASISLSGMRVSSLLSSVANSRIIPHYPQNRDQ